MRQHRGRDGKGPFAHRKGRLGEEHRRRRFTERTVEPVRRRSSASPAGRMQQLFRGRPNTMMTFQVGPEWAGMRLDRFVSRWLKLPRQLLYKAVRAGLIRVSGRKEKPDYHLGLGDEVTAEELASNRSVSEEVPSIPDAALKALRAAVLVEDAHILVIDKPPGLPVHAGSGHAYG